MIFLTALDEVRQMKTALVHFAMAAKHFDVP